MTYLYPSDRSLHERQPDEEPFEDFSEDPEGRNDMVLPRSSGKFVNFPFTSRDPLPVHKEVEARNMVDRRNRLSAFGIKLSEDMKAGKINSKEAIDKFYEKARELTRPNSDPAGDALLLATSSALRIRGREYSDVITRNSLGDDTLHHFFINAVNTYRGVPVYVQQFGANYLRQEDDARDINANNLGAVFGSRLRSELGSEVIIPSSVITSPPPREHDRVRKFRD